MDGFSQLDILLGFTLIAFLPVEPSWPT